MKSPFSSVSRARVFIHTFGLIPLLVFLAGCASLGTKSNPGGGNSASEASVLLEKARQSVTPAQKMGFLVAAAESASRDIASGNETNARLDYNEASADLAIALKSPGAPSLPATITTPSGPVVLAFAPPSKTGQWAPSHFTKLVPLADINNKALVSKVPPAGFGGVLVGAYCPPNPRSLYLPRVGVSAPVTAVVNFTKPARSGGVSRATVTLYDSSKIDKAVVAGMSRPLASDLSAPFGYYPIPPKMGIQGMLRPNAFFENEGLFLTQPYDQKKIPLVLIHGLMSDPQMWLPVMASIESDPVLRGKYQYWVFAYPTGNPVAYSALELRDSLAGVYKVYPGSKDMVIVNHSLGGCITHLQMIDTGNVLVKEIFKSYAPKILALPDDSLVKRGLIFRANPRIARVVFVAAPHRGAPLAYNPIAEWVSGLIKLPGNLLTGIGTSVLQDAGAAAGIKGNFVPTGISGLNPNSPLLVAMNTLPMKSPFHSIIGVFGNPQSPLEKTSDTVVPYWSSHEEKALSEKIVPYPHTAMFAKPLATDEIKRILLLHLKSTGNTSQNN